VSVSRLTIYPVVLGAGERLFGETTRRKPMRLVRAQTVGDGLAFLTYEPVPDAQRARALACTVRARARLGRQSLSKLTFFLGSFSDQDPFIFGAVLLGVEQHEVAAHGAFDPDGEGHVHIVILADAEMVTVGRRPALDQERGKAPDAERVR
jgi:hypothetical protein